MRGGDRAALQHTGSQVTDFSRLGAHLPLGHFSRFDPKVPHFSRKFPPGRRGFLMCNIGSSVDDDDDDGDDCRLVQRLHGRAG